MRKHSRAIVEAIVMFWSFLGCMQSVWGQAPAKSSELYFHSSPTKQRFALGENVVTNLEFWSRSEQPLYVSRLQNGAFVTFKVTGPDGHEIPWRDSRNDVKQYSASDFTVLNQYRQIKGDRIISLKDGEGFAFDKPGQYSLTAEFSMDPSSRFTAAAGRAKPPVGIFQSKTSFCIEACISEPFPVRNNAPQSSVDAVRAFYNIITRYQKPGIPAGREMKALRPLLSKRLAHLLDSLQDCDADYYERYGKILRANTYKPATLRFATKQTYDPGLRVPESYDHFEGVVTAIWENNRWVIDDYVAMYENDDLHRLSAGYRDCKDNHWVGETP
jgi:hypothetical protein